MSTYFMGACHNCRQWIWLSNVDMNYAEECLKHWVENDGHEGHNVEATSEYDPIFEYRINGLKTTKYLGYDEWETERDGEPYRLMNEDDGFSYNRATFETCK